MWTEEPRLLSSLAPCWLELPSQWTNQDLCKDPQTPPPSHTGSGTRAFTLSYHDNPTPHQRQQAVIGCCSVGLRVNKDRKLLTLCG